MTPGARQLILAGCSLADLLDFLRSADSFRLTPFNFLRVLLEAVGMSVRDGKEILSLFDPTMASLVPTAEAEQLWRSVIDTQH